MRQQLLLVLALFFSFSTLSTSLLAQCVQGNCQDGYGTFVFKSGAKYMGDFKKGVIDGQGILYFSNGDKYIGQWKKHYREGRGKLIYANGDTYQGTFVQSKLQGKGTMNYSSGDRFEGAWNNDQPEGIGIYITANGDRYEGTFVDGQMHGQGTMVYQNGDTYTGAWQNGQRHGEGKFSDGQAIVQEGTWENDTYLTEDTPLTADIATSEKNLQNCNKLHCHRVRGTYRYPDGSRYVGDFKDGRPDGEGTCYYANGDKYVGNFSNHAPNGEGIYTYVSGRVTAAMWKNGQPQRRIEAAQENIPIQVSKEVKIWSVVVGISTYDHMPALRFTDDDAYRFYSFLKSPEGGAIPDEQITILIDEDATRHNIIAALKSTLLKADKNDAIVFYYSGHGLEGSLIPVDYDGYNNQLYNEDIKQIFDKSQAKHKVIFSDACYSGSLLAMKSSLNSMMRKYYQSFENTEGGLAFLTSSKSEEVSLEDGGLRQGIYTHFLIRGLNGEADKDRNKIVTVSELFAFVKAGVRSYTGNMQTPVLTGNYDAGMPVAVIR